MVLVGNLIVRSHSMLLARQAVISLCFLAMITATVGCTTAELKNGRVQTRFEQPNCAILATGQISTPGSLAFGVSDQIGVVRLNVRSYEDYNAAITNATGAGERTFLNISGTPYAFVLVNGAVQPLVLDWSQWEVWRLEGLGKYFSRCQTISPGKARVTFSYGMPDTDLAWSFDFGNKLTGVVITFNASGGF